MTTAQLEIRLEPHIGMQMTALGPVPVDLKQYRVLAQTEHTGFRWVQLGYVCQPCAANPTPPFNGLDTFRTLPQALKDEVCARVRELLQTPRMTVTEIPEPPETEPEEDDPDDDDDVDS